MDYRLDGATEPSDPNVSPDGQSVAFVVTETDSSADEYRAGIWVESAGSLRQFTTSGHDTSPRWSPDGTRLAFVRKSGDTAQLAVIAVNGGEAEVVTDFPLGVAGEPVWSPDGSAIAIVGVVWEPDWSEIDDEERARRPRRIDRRAYRADGRGWTHDRRRHVFVVDVSGTGVDPRRLTAGGEDEEGPAWSPDGSRIALLTDLSGSPGYLPGKDVVVTSVSASGEPEPAGPRGMWDALAFDEGGVLHALGYPGTAFPDHAALWRLGPEPEQVNEHAERSLFGLGSGPQRLLFRDGRAIVPFVDSGAVGVAAVSSSGETEMLIDEKAVVTGIDLRSGCTAFTVSEVASATRLVVDRDGDRRQFDDFGGRRLPAIEPQHFVVRGGGGDLDVWVYLPPGGGEVPLLLNIHGGPATQYGWGYFDEFQIYAEAGYGVVATNPRGSTGGDRDFLRAVRGEAWGMVDMEDVDAAVAAALEKVPRLDAGRMAVMGGSYGGLLTAWLIGHQDRWKAAIVERALLSWPSFAGTSDIGGWFSDRYLGGRDLEWDKSPLRLASRVQTPTLVIHSENDFRCPIEQAEQYFDALLCNGVEAEFVRFPGEGHELTRSGKPRHREERFEIVLEWLGRWI